MIAPSDETIVDEAESRRDAGSDVRNKFKAKAERDSIGRAITGSSSCAWSTSRKRPSEWLQAPSPPLTNQARLEQWQRRRRKQLQSAQQGDAHSTASSRQPSQRTTTSRRQQQSAASEHAATLQGSVAFALPLPKLRASATASQAPARRCPCDSAQRSSRRLQSRSLRPLPRRQLPRARHATAAPNCCSA